MSKALVILFKPSGKYYTEEYWEIPYQRVSLPLCMNYSPDFRRIDGGPVLVPTQEPWGFPALLLGIIMNKHKLADKYVSEVMDEQPQIYDRWETTPLALALLRACEDLLICKDEFQRYKDSIVRERQEDLARALGVNREWVSKTLKDGFLEREVMSVSNQQTDTEPQDRSGAEQPPVSRDPQDEPVTQQEGHATVDPDTLDSPVTCANCGTPWPVLRGSPETGGELITCPVCHYREDRT